MLIINLYRIITLKCLFLFIDILFLFVFSSVCLLRLISNGILKLIRIYKKKTFLVTIARPKVLVKVSIIIRSVNKKKRVYLILNLKFYFMKNYVALHIYRL